MPQNGALKSVQKSNQQSGVVNHIPASRVSIVAQTYGKQSASVQLDVRRGASERYRRGLFGSGVWRNRLLPLSGSFR